MSKTEKAPQTWDQVIPNISVSCTARETIPFQGFAIAQGTTFEGIYIGTTKENGTFRVAFDVPSMQKQLGIEPHFVSVTLLDARRCFRCDRYLALPEFQRSTLLQDKSPILFEVCSDCYRRARNQVTSRRSQANKEGAENTLKVSEWLEKLLVSQGHCHYCDKLVGYAELIIEHMTPISWKGGHTKENIVPACIPCNSSKGDRDVETWKRSVEAKYLLELLQDNLQLSKFEVTNLAIKYLAIYKGLIAEDVEE